MAISKLLKQTVETADAAAQIIMQVYDRGRVSVELKADKSPLTEADTASHEFILEALSHCSGWPVLSEEELVPFATRRSWQRFWLVDPLDGTKDFLARNGDFTVNIALIDDQQPILGVIALPAQGVIYLAEKGSGAYRQSKNGLLEKVSRNQVGARLPISAESRFHSSEQNLAFCKRHGIKEILHFGSAIKFCKLAEGVVDVYPRFGRTGEWDTAAGHCLVREAGCEVIDLGLAAPLTYNKPEPYHCAGFIAAPNAFDLVEIERKTCHA